MEDFVAHIEDDNFFMVYGNPVAVINDGNQDCVVMSIEYAERLHKSICDAEKELDVFAVMMACEDYTKYQEDEDNV